MAESFVFLDGVKEYAINGDENRVLRVNTADANLLPRLYKSFENAQVLMKNVKEIDVSNPSMEVIKEGIDTISELDTAIRNGFDEVFYPGAAEVVFGKTNVLAYVGNGITLYESFMTAFIAKMEKEIKKNASESDKRMQEYKNAYDKQKAEYREYVGRIAK